MLHYQLTVVVCDVFLAGVGESLLSSEGSDPGLTSRRYYFSVLALWPKSCQHIFYPCARTVYFPSLSLFSCRSSCPMFSMYIAETSTQFKVLIGPCNILKSYNLIIIPCHFSSFCAEFFVFRGTKCVQFLR